MSVMVYVETRARHVSDLDYHQILAVLMLFTIQYQRINNSIFAMILSSF